jgi:hypothetical protein
VRSGDRKHIFVSGFEGSQAIPARISGRSMFETGRSIRKRKDTNLEEKNLSRVFTANDRN